MSSWVLLLRGINVGGSNRLPMGDLVGLLEGLGLRKVRTYIASGNVVFESDANADPEALASSITAAVRGSHGFAPRAMVLRAAAIRAAIEGNPFPEAVAVPQTLHVLFLEVAPASPDLAGLDAVRGPREEYVLDGSVLYLHLPDGLGRSKLALRAERLLGVAATARNWNTVATLGSLVSVSPDGS